MRAPDRPTSRQAYAARALRAAAFALFVLAGCGQGTYRVNETCSKLEAPTGGDPTGKWNVTSYCQIPYARTAADDWCSKLVYSTTGVQDGLFLGTEVLPIVGMSATVNSKGQHPLSEITYTSDPMCGQACGTYEATLIYEGTSTTNFPLGCLRQHIPDPTCDDLGAKIQRLVNVLPTIQNVHCTKVDADDSCDCTYLVTTATIFGDAGAWRVKDNQLIHYPSTGVQAGLADFAIDGTQLHLRSHDNQPLLAHDALRSLDLVRATP